MLCHRFRGLQSVLICRIVSFGGLLVSTTVCFSSLSSSFGHICISVEDNVGGYVLLCCTAMAELAKIRVGRLVFTYHRPYAPHPFSFRQAPPFSRVSAKRCTPLSILHAAEGFTCNLTSEHTFPLKIRMIFILWAMLPKSCSMSGVPSHL